MLGLELRDRVATAVALDDEGRVLARASVPDVADLASAAAAALAGVAAAAPGARLGVAALHPEAAEVQAALVTLAARHAGPCAAGLAVPSGAAAAVAEAWVGAARGARDVVLFSVADHACAGLLRDGAPMSGAHRRGPAVAWLALNPVEREDYRKAGCLEAETAEAGIVRRFVWRIKSGDRSRVQDLVGSEFGAITLDHVLDAARAGDGVSISVVRDTAKYLGMAAANLVAVTDPAVLVLGGIMASAADLLFEPVRTELTRRLPVAMVQTLTVVPALLGADAPAIGAARLATAASS